MMDAKALRQMSNISGMKRSTCLCSMVSQEFFRPHHGDQAHGQIDETKHKEISEIGHASHPFLPCKQGLNQGHTPPMSLEI
mmetsp:Transcript_84963/g.153056  ORF Transcript_84963/g.153056 Transcript_84963/m.153056 type:complete len:81 (-) Transcript_84963:45-287(-)